ncbi:ABC-type glycine betaine transport system, substrate-binding domain [Syntrophomonas zehnderi OL-4]|uniref:ABC-type glycine betaine transport system, substrate-binding domain n=1 Tax=Syntrophomonas zehnderi OL-4 TaxID=690567 RepID=A0A0E3W3J7_9FIRM|nr:glycine betaine ABC transporter substrate-binding protein [Syntrophomonas zehnderi]CFW98954.1 ABC-type glycine betaine transport system, substrate-binding domain [Syntrophomonas zehnderi OL-4]CFX87790.1 ABC-type glycine betaine transport system, substrate-binding domain [Syntrophomonas zehnderi OL-4]
MKISRRNNTIPIIAMLLLLSFTLVGCGGGKSPQNKAGKDTVRLVYVEWACATASAHVVADVLENKMGYKVELTPVSAPLLYEALASGDADAMTTAWLPITHENYLKKMQGKIENLGPNCEGAKLALTVPAYVTIDSVEELNAKKENFGGQIIGIDPGASYMKLTEKVINEYGLDYELVEGTDATMTAALKSAIDKNEWIVVTGWIPHWKFARWDLKILDEPKNIYGDSEYIATIVRPGLKTDMPEVYEFLQNFKWSIDDLQNAMLLSLEYGSDSKKAAHKWTEENPELVNRWLPEKYKK